MILSKTDIPFQKKVFQIYKLMRQDGIYYYCSFKLLNFIFPFFFTSKYNTFFAAYQMVFNTLENLLVLLWKKNILRCDWQMRIMEL